jgi:hypothetical protein
VPTCGREARRFLYGIDFNYPSLLRQKRALETAIADTRDAYEIPSRAFVFEGSQGYAFFLFEDVASEPPIVTSWAEGSLPAERYFHTFE